MLTWILENSLVALILAGVVVAVCRGLRARPAVCHLLWMLVLVCLMAPPIPVSHWPSQEIRPTLSSFWWELAARGDDGRLEETGVPENENAFEKKTGERTDGDDTSIVLAPLAGASSHQGGAMQGARASLADGLAVARPFLNTLWLVGSLLVAFVLVRRIARFQGLVRRGGAVSPALMLSVRTVAARLSVRAPKVVELPELKTPMVWSLGRPLVLWPSEQSEFTKITEQHSIIAHELAHLRRRDHWVAWLDMAGMVLCWWNPLFWLVRNRMRHHAELACDAWAVWAFPKRRKAYAEALIHVLQRYSSPPLAGAALGIADSTRKSFQRRLSMIMAPRISRHVSTPWAIAAILVTVMVLPGWSREEASEPASNLVAARLQQAVDLCIDELHGARYLKSKEWEKAADSYRHIVAHDPGNGDAWNALGRAKMEIGDIKGAVAAFQKQEVLGKAPKKSRLAVAIAYARAGDSKRSIASLEQALHAGFHDVGKLEKDYALQGLIDGEDYADVSKACSEAKAIAKKAKHHFDKREWKEAAAAAQRAAHAMPECGKTHHVLGVSLIGAGKIEAAYEVLQRQAQLGHKPGVAHYNMACCQSLAGNPESALAHLQKSLSLGFRDAKLMAKDTDLDGVRKHDGFQELLELSQQKRYSEKEIGRALEEGDYKQAAFALEEMSRDEQGHSADSRGWACAKLGKTLLKLGRIEGAIEAFHRQAELGHEVSGALRHAATGYARLGHADRAFAYLQGAIDTGYHEVDDIRSDESFKSLHDDPRFKTTVQSAIDGAVLGRFNAVDWKHLQQRSKELCQKDPEDGEGFYSLGWAELRLGRPEKAIEAYQRQESLGYAPLVARYNIACCCAMLGRKDEAFAWLDKAVDGGLADPQQVAHDPDLAGLRGDPRFAAFVKRIEEKAKVMKEKKKNWGDGKDHDDYEDEGKKKKKEKKEKKEKYEVRKKDKF